MNHLKNMDNGQILLKIFQLILDFNLDPKVRLMDMLNTLKNELSWEIGEGQIRLTWKMIKLECNSDLKNEIV